MARLNGISNGPATPRIAKRVLPRSIERTSELDGLLRTVPCIGTEESIASVPDRFLDGIPVVAVVDDRGVPIGMVRGEGVLEALDARHAASIPGIRAMDAAVPAPSVSVDGAVDDAIDAITASDSDIVLVVGDDGALAGAVLAQDLLAEGPAHGLVNHGVAVAELATPVFNVEAGAPLATITRLFGGTPVRGLLVMDGNGAVEGVITPHWLLEVARSRPDSLSEITARDLLQTRVVILDAGDDIGVAADRMVAADAVCGVVMADGAVAGVVWPEILLKQSRGPRSEAPAPGS